MSPVAGPVALPLKAAQPSLLAPGVPSLAAFLDLMIGKIALPTATPAPSSGERQDDAATGKSLPDADRPQVDAALAWLFGAPPMPVAQPTLTAPLASGSAPFSPVRSVTPATTPVVAAPVPLADNVAPVATPAVTAPIAPAPPLVGKDMPSPVTPQVELPRPHIVPATISAKPDIAPKPLDPNIMIGPVAPLPVVSPVAVPLPALFALGHGPETREDDIPATPAMPAAAPTLPTPQAVAPAADTQRQSLDMGDRDWPQKMIDRIETLRDNANATDTSIRLKPEALGRVDIALKTHADGAVSVRFTAEQPATRTLLIDAAPQLTAAADARGIRLSGTSVDLSGQGDHRPRPEIDRREPITNRVAPAGDEPEADPLGRIA